jgi:hypothetical protein
MKRARHSHCTGEGLAIWIIVLAILAGGAWFVYSSHDDSVRGAHAFAEEVTQKVTADFDDHYLLVHLNPENQAAHLPAWRERLFRSLRGFGPMTKPPQITGDVRFTSYFFDPRGTFRVDLSYAAMPVHLDLELSKGTQSWRIDEINLVWDPPRAPAPSPTPAIAPSPTPSPTPTPEPQQPQRKKKHG